MTPAAAPTDGTPDARLRALGLELPAVPEQPPGHAPRPIVPVVVHGTLAFFSGVAPLELTGTIGTDMSVEEGYAAARTVGLMTAAAHRRRVRHRSTRSNASSRSPATSVPRRASPANPKSSTASPISSSRCTARTAAVVHARRSVRRSCPATSPSRWSRSSRCATRAAVAEHTLGAPRHRLAVITFAVLVAAAVVALVVLAWPGHSSDSPAPTLSIVPHRRAARRRNGSHPHHRRRSVRELRRRPHASTPRSTRRPAIRVWSSARPRTTSTRARTPRSARACRRRTSSP